MNFRQSSYLFETNPITAVANKSQLLKEPNPSANDLLRQGWQRGELWPVCVGVLHSASAITVQWRRGSRLLPHYWAHLKVCQWRQTIWDVPQPNQFTWKENSVCPRNLCWFGPKKLHNVTPLQSTVKSGLVKERHGDGKYLFFLDPSYIPCLRMKTLLYTD